MPVTVVVGGQFGSEGKGKVAYLLAKDLRATAAVRVGGPNSGHTVVDGNGRTCVFRQLPTAAILSGVECIIPAGSYVDVDVLLREIEVAKIGAERLIIDPNAVIVTKGQIKEEAESHLTQEIGSTATGTGAAIASRIARNGSVRFAKADARVAQYVRSTTPILRGRIRAGERVVIEGTQGFGLSILHSPHYPFVTSRDTTASTFVAEAGISPLDVDDVVLVLRAFPIRVSGRSGPLPRELTWDEVSHISGSRGPLCELTSVTRRVRRVAQFDPEIVRLALMHNEPTRVVLNHVDYVDATCAAGGPLTLKALEFVEDVEREIGRAVDLVGLGPNHLALRSGLVKAGSHTEIEIAEEAV